MDLSTPSARRLSRHQQGFIQGTILFALAILGVIVAAFAVSTTGSSTNTDSERARVYSGVILKAGADLQDAVSRALADQHPGSSIQLGVPPATPAAGTLYLYDPKYRYGVEPRLPEQAFTGATSQLFTVVNSVSISGDAGKNDLILQLPGLREDVCRRVNNLAKGGAFDVGSTIAVTMTAAVTAGLTLEGCFGAGTPASPYTYYRLMASDIT